MRSTKLPSWIERILGRKPPSLPPPHVFTLGPRELRHGSFHRSDKGYVFDSTEAVELPPDTFPEGSFGAPARDPRAFKEEVLAFVAGLAGPIESASLLLPDTWLRLTFLELAELPRRNRERQEILRWKLKRQVPLRVEDLRFEPLAVTPYPTQEEPVRLLVGFALEVLISQIEEVFTAAGIELGAVTNTTLATLHSLDHAVSPRDLATLVMVQDDAYTLSYFREGEPLLYRYKALGDIAGSALAGAVRRDLRMTAGFMAEHFPAEPLRRAFLAAPPESEDRWLGWLHDELEVPPEPLSFEHFRIVRTQVGPSWLETAPLLGAASLPVT